MFTSIELNRKIIVSVAAFFYTLLYGSVVSIEFWFRILIQHTSEGVSSSDIDFLRRSALFLLTGLLILLLVKLFENLHNKTKYIYFSSIVAAVLIPGIFPGMTGGGGFGLGGVPWWFSGIILAIANSLFGPAMQAFVILRIIKIIKILHKGKENQQR